MPIDVEYRYIPAKLSSYRGCELRVEEAKNGTVGQPLPHIFDSLLVCGQINADYVSSCGGSLAGASRK